MAAAVAAQAEAHRAEVQVEAQVADQVQEEVATAVELHIREEVVATTILEWSSSLDLAALTTKDMATSVLMDVQSMEYVEPTISAQPASVNGFGSLS